MGSTRAHDSVLDAIYEAALQPEAWPNAQRLMCEALDARCSMLWEAELPVLTASWHSACGNMASMVEEYTEGGAASDPRVEYALGLPPGRVMRDQDFIDEAEMNRHPYYTEFLARDDLRYCIAAKLFQDSSAAGALDLQRRRRRGPFTDTEAESFDVWQRHVGRAREIQRRLALPSQRSVGLDAVLEAFTQPLLAVDGNGSCRVTNAAAARLLEQGDGIRLRARTLRCEYPASHRALGGFIRSASTGTTGGSCAIRRPSGRRPYWATVVPVRGALIHHGRTLAAMISINDPEAAPADAATRLRDAFHLTPAETQFALRFASSCSLDDTAESLGITRETARWRMKQVQSKTETKSQAELVAVVLTAVPRFGDPDN